MTALLLSSYPGTGTEKLNAAFADLLAAGGGRLHVDGIFNVDTEPNALPEVPIKIFGDGGDFSQLVKGTPGTEFRILHKDSTNWVDFLQLEGFRITGDWLQAQTSGSDATRLVRVIYYRSVVVDRMEFFFSRQMGLTAGTLNNITVRDCRFFGNARDSLNSTHAWNVDIHDNLFLHGGDDMIAVHDFVASPVQNRKTIKIVNNIGFDILGIKVLGNQDCLIAGNVLNWPKNYGIRVGRDGAEGQNGRTTTMISSNIITNITPGALWGLGDVQTGIQVDSAGDPIDSIAIQNNLIACILADGDYSSYVNVTDTRWNPSLLGYHKDQGWIDPAVTFAGGRSIRSFASNAVAETTLANNVYKGVAAPSIVDT